MESFELVEGRVVLYCLAEGVYRPAFVVKVWSLDNGCSNLQVFVDGTNDLHYGVPAEAAQRGVVWKTSIVRGEGVGQWITPMELVSLRAQQA